MRLVVNDGCHLCEEAEPIVRKVAERHGLELGIVDMGSDDELVRLYSWRIPVVLDWRGEVVAEGIISERELRKAMRKLKRPV